jgi:tetratricopeptide (TPR) repeat protein
LDVCPFTCGILLTTIRPEQGYGDYVHRVDPLPSGIAYKVLRRWSGHNADNDPSVDAICRLAGNLPLALRIAGSYIRSSGMKPSEYVELLSINGLAALTLEDRNRQSIGRLIGRTIQMLSEGAYRVLGAVGMLAPGPFADITIAAAVDAPAQQVQQWLNELVRYSLLIRVEQPVGVNHARWYQVVHSLIYWYAQASDLAPTGAAQRLAVYYAAQMNVALNTTPVPVAWLASEREHWVAVLDACHSASAWQALWQLAEPLEEYFDRQGLDPMRVKVCEQALAAVRALHQRKAEAYWLNLLGLAQKRIGNIHAACSMFTHGLEISREVDDRRLEAVCLNNLGITYRLLGRVELSITHNQQALEIDRDIENRRGMGHDLKGLGEAYADAGNLDQALVAYSHALLLLHETGERREEAFCLIRLGQAQIILGHWEVAIEHLQAALLISRQVNDRLSEHESLTYLGKVYAAQGDEQMAKFYAQLAAEVMHEIGRLDL